MLSKFNNKKHRRLTALLLCVALMLGSVTSVSADISAADSETEVQSEVQTYEHRRLRQKFRKGHLLQRRQKHLQQTLSRQRPISKLQQKHIQRRQLRHRRLRQQKQQLRRFGLHRLEMQLLK